MPPRSPRSILFPYTTLFRSIPPVMTGDSHKASRTSGTVHILGDDRRAGFLACELQQVYESVHVFKSVKDKLVDFKYEPSNPSGRSEEHTSELQSRENLVCRL